MNNLTPKQQQIISDITEQFKSINESVKPSASFNFIDLSEFDELKRQGDIRTAEIDIQNQALRSAVLSEMTAMAEALNHDFKNTKLRAEVKEYGKSIELVITAGLKPYFDGEFYKIQIETLWTKNSYFINNSWVDELCCNSYEINSRPTKEVQINLVDLVKSDSFKKLLNQLYIKSIK